MSKVLRNIIIYNLKLLSCVKWSFKRKKFFLLYLPLIFIILTFIVFYFYFLTCSYAEIKTAIDVVCKAYFTGKAFGNLCSHLCQTKHLYPSTCIPNHLGKDVVFEATLSDIKKPVIIKTSKLNYQELDQVFWTNDVNDIYYPSLTHFYDMLHDSVSRNLHLKDDTVAANSSLIKLIWPGDFHNIKNLSKVDQQSVMNNIWFLVQQPEYLFLKYYDSTKLFPHILGTCGHFYIEEFIKPLDSLFLVIYPVWKKNFIERAGFALQIIEYLENIENRFPKLQICDVKVGHFGIGSDGNMKLLDMDMVFHEPSLIQNMLAIKNCAKDDDCSFIDCQGSCDVTSKECKPIVGNSNFQRVCLNIFIGKFAQKYFGLLAQPPLEIKKKLQKLWKKCTSKMSSSTILEVKEELKIILKNAVRKSIL